MSKSMSTLRVEAKNLGINTYKMKKVEIESAILAVTQAKKDGDKPKSVSKELKDKMKISCKPCLYNKPSYTRNPISCKKYKQRSRCKALKNTESFEDVKEKGNQSLIIEICSTCSYHLESTIKECKKYSLLRHSGGRSDCDYLQKVVEGVFNI